MVREPGSSRAGKMPATKNRRSSILLEVEDNSPQEIDFNDFMNFVKEKPEWLYQKIKDMHDRHEEDLETRNAQDELENQAKDGRMTMAQQELNEAKQQLAQAELDRDGYSQKIVQMVMDQATSLNRSVADGNASSQSSRKSAKIPDPPLLTDGKEPHFEDWLLLMTQKLKANGDHYDSPQLRIAYVASRCDGRARKHITPRMREGVSNPYDDSKSMLDHLKTIYDDPNRVTTAKNSFRSLYMKTTDKFHDFLSEFLYLAAEAGISEDDWKDELYHRITTKLQELTINEVIKGDSFQEFSSVCSQTASRLEVMNLRNQRNRNLGSTASYGKNSTKSTTSAAAPDALGSTNVKKEPTDNRNQLMKEGKCFTCFEQGHMSRDCPKKHGSSAIQELEDKSNKSENA